MFLKIIVISEISEFGKILLPENPLCFKHTQVRKLRRISYDLSAHYLQCWNDHEEISKYQMQKIEALRIKSDSFCAR